MPAEAHSTSSRARPVLTLALVAGLSLALAAGFWTLVSQGSADAEGAASVGSTACWILVGLGIIGTTLVSNGRGRGWLLLFGLQPIWIAYAMSTGQPGLVLGCVAHAAAQVNGFLRSVRQLG